MLGRNAVDLYFNLYNFVLAFGCIWRRKPCSEAVAMNAREVVAATPKAVLAGLDSVMGLRFAYRFHKGQSLSFAFADSVRTCSHFFPCLL